MTKFSASGRGHANHQEVICKWSDQAGCVPGRMHQTVNWYAGKGTLSPVMKDIQTEAKVKSHFLPIRLMKLSLKFNLIFEVQLIYNVVPISVVQQGDSIIHIQTFFNILFHYCLSQGNISNLPVRLLNLIKTDAGNVGKNTFIGTKEGVQILGNFLEGNLAKFIKIEDSHSLWKLLQ